MSVRAQLDLDPRGVVTEVFVVCIDAGNLAVVGPPGRRPPALEPRGGDHPLETARRWVADAIGDPLLVHSTSWRYERDTVVLTFLAVIEKVSGAGTTRAIRRVELARSEPVAAPARISHDEVLEHALRHLAWLAMGDQRVLPALSARWRVALASCAPEPFRNLG